MQRGKGYLPADENMARHYNDRSNSDPVSFAQFAQEVLVLGTYDICACRGWRAHGVGTDPTHFRAVISWTDFLEWSEVRRVLKNVLSLLLGRALNALGRRWFVRDGSRKRVLSIAHLEHLKTVYLPDHCGVFWREGLPLPPDRFGILNS